MPYIKEEDRTNLDDCINEMIRCIGDNKSLDDNDFLLTAGKINYSFSRIVAGIMGSTSYAKIAIITGVLENIKQEFYRRIASPYEDLKIVQNGDIKEYKRLS
jgi:hypothetical protein